MKQVWAGRAEEREYLRKVSSHRELELEWSMLCQVCTSICLMINSAFIQFDSLKLI